MRRLMDNSSTGMCLEGTGWDYWTNFLCHITGTSGGVQHYDGTCGSANCVLLFDSLYRISFPP